MINIQIGSLDTFAVIDMGADITIMSEKLFNKIPAMHKSPVEPGKYSDGNVVGISGHKLNSLGVSKIKCQIGPTTWEISFEILRGVSHTALLGSDFLATSQAQLDFNERTLKVGNFVTLMYRKDERSSVSLVEVTKKQYIPPSSNCILHAKVIDSSVQGTCILTPLDNSPLFLTNRD